MNVSIGNPLKLNKVLVGISAIGLALTMSVAAPPTILHNFSLNNGINPPGSNADGAFPQTGLVESAGFLYGVTLGGGQFANGTVFRMTTNGSDFTTLKSFNFTDGSSPLTKLAISGTTLYGATTRGGAADGTLFKVNTDGTGFGVLRHLAEATDGKSVAALIVSGSTLYGLAASGTLFRIGTDGTGFTVLHQFGGRSASPPDGKDPLLLTLINNQLYGTTSKGGTNDHGTIFRIATSGTGYTVLKSLDGAAEGSHPVALLPYGGQLIGINLTGSNQLYGTLFRMNMDGTGYSVVANLPGGANGLLRLPEMVLQGNTIYGTTYDGPFGLGSIFKVNTDGSGLETLSAFTNMLNGGGPCGGVILAGNQLYGTASVGGLLGGGIVYKWTVAGSSMPAAPVPLQSPVITNGNFMLRFQTVNNVNYSIEQTTNFAMAHWTSISNFVGNGSLFQMGVPVNEKPSAFFRVLAQ